MTSLPLPISTNLLYKVGDGLAGRVIHSTYKRINKFFPVEISPNIGITLIALRSDLAKRMLADSILKSRSSVLCPGNIRLLRSV